MADNTPETFVPKCNSKYTPELAQQIADMVAQGTPIKFAAEAAGIGRDTFYRWLEADPTLKTSIEKRRAEAVRERVNLIQEAARKPQHWTAACWWLERQHPEEFGLKQQNQDIAITVQVRDCTQDTRVQVVAGQVTSQARITNQCDEDKQPDD